MALIDRLKQNEGTKRGKSGLHIPYHDSENLLTIGYGILIDPETGGLYDEEAEFLLQNRIKLSLNQAQQFPWFSKLNQVRQEVIVEMVYNLGYPRFNGFKKMIAALEQGDFDEAAKEGRDSKWRNQVGNRAIRLMKALESGVV